MTTSEYGFSHLYSWILRGILVHFSSSRSLLRRGRRHGRGIKRTSFHSSPGLGVARWVETVLLPGRQAHKATDRDARLRGLPALNQMSNGVAAVAGLSVRTTQPDIG